jgi:lactoylglutathione lyase
LRVSYVVLYVEDAVACRRFWVDVVGMVEKVVNTAGGYEIVRVGFAEQPFAFELVPLALMADNPEGLDLATPSVCFDVDDVESTRATLLAKGVQVTEVTHHHGVVTCAFADPEDRWFAVIER